MSSILLSFDLGRISQDQLPLFMAHAAKLDMLYRELAGIAPPQYEAPPAESLPQPDFDDKVEAEKDLEEMSGQELRDCLADLTGKPRGKKTSTKFPTKADLIAEIRRVQASPERKVEEKDGTLMVSAERRMSEDSLQEKKPRKSRWEGMTPEQVAEEKAKIGARLKAGREAKKAKKAAAAEETNGSA